VVKDTEPEPPPGENSDGFISSSVYLTSCMAVSAPNLLRIPQFKQRPPGTHFLGANNLTLPGHLLTIDTEPYEILLDTGAAVSLISEYVYSRLPNRPKPKKGIQTNILTVTGTAEMGQYVTMPIYFKTDQGPIELSLDLYIIQGMNIPVIIGTDYQDQYLISINRSADGTTVTFGNSGRTISAKSSIYSTEDIQKYAALANPSKPTLNNQSSKNPKDSLVRAATEIKIPPHTAKLIPIKINWPNKISELFVQAIQTFTDSGENAYLMEAIITKDSPQLVMVNRSMQVLIIDEDEVIGESKDPYFFLDKDVLQAAQAPIFALKILFEELQKPVTPIYEPEAITTGPNVAELPPEAVPREELLNTIHINPDLTSKQKETITNLVLKHEDAFGLDDKLGNPDFLAEIKIKPDAQPVSSRPYHANPINRKAIDDHLERWTKQGLIEPSRSPWASPVIVVWRNGKPRVCIDFREVNKRTIPDEYPLPRQTDILQALQGSQWLSTMDALGGFHNIPVKNEDKEKLAFKTHQGLFQFRRMPLGITNGPAIFQRIMNEVLTEILWLFVLVYIDDIVVYSHTFDEHIVHLDRVLAIIKAAKINLSPKKCFFGYQSLLLLGQKVSRLGMSTHREKVDAIDRLLPPTNIKTLQTFLGMIVYFHLYIPFYAWLISPLFKLLRKDKKWEWTEEHQNAFEVAKQVLKSSPVLAYGMPGLGYRLYTDASIVGLSGILQQVQPIAIRDLKHTRIYEKLKSAYDAKDPPPVLYRPTAEGMEPIRQHQPWNSNFDDTIVMIERVIAYWSRTLRSAEQNYSVTELEALALDQSLRKFQPYLEGENVVVITDHSALTWSKTFENANRRLMLWGLLYKAYPKIHILHRAGRVNSNVDPLSRLETRIPNFTDVNRDPGIAIDLQKDQKLQKFEKFKEITYAGTTVAAAEVTTLRISADLIQRYLEGYKSDSFCRKKVEDLKSTINWRIPKSFYLNDEGLLYFIDATGHSRLIVPKTVRNEVLQNHDHLDELAHFGAEKTYLKLSRNYYWPNMLKDIKNYVASCDICQKSKPKTHAPYGYLIPIPIPANPWEKIAMDFIPDLPLTKKGNNCVYTITDTLTKELVAEPTVTTLNEKQTAEIFRKEIINKKGVPLDVISDRDPRWRESFWKEVSSTWGASRALTTAHHPQADGATEVMNRVIEIGLRSFCNENLDNWDELLPEFVATYNSTPHLGTGYTPFYLNHGREMRQVADILNPQLPDNPIIVEKEGTKIYLEALQAARAQASDAIVRAKEDFTTYYNKHHLDVEFEIGDKVLINPRSIKLSGEWQGPGNKLLQRYEGPFEIIDKYSPITYKIRIPADWNIHNVLNISHLEKYRESPEEFRIRPTRPIRSRKPTSKEEWEVIRIINEKYIKKQGQQRRALHYQAEWKYPDGSVQITNEWIDAKDFRNAPEVVQAWKNQRNKKEFAQPPGTEATVGAV
jgi:hypothetical protein